MQCEDNYPHILLVDDDELLRDSFALFFHDNGWSCDVCEDGKAGLKAAISGNYDVVITDLMMPNLSGLDLLRELHKVKPSQAVMVVTGVATMDDAISALRMGAVDFLQKPVELSFLESAIKRVVPGMQSERLNLRLGQHVHRCAAEYELVSRELVGKSVDIPLIEDLNAAGVITVCLLYTSPSPRD